MLLTFLTSLHKMVESFGYLKKRRGQAVKKAAMMDLTHSSNPYERKRFVAFVLFLSPIKFE